MAEIAELFQESASKPDNLASIDLLRSSIEQEHMFKTGLVGYQKQEVQTYLNRLSDGYENTIREQGEEIRRLEAENRQLCAQIEVLKEKLVGGREEERRKLQTEYSMQEGLVESLRERNSRLMADNQSKQVEITMLQEQLRSVRSVVAERSGEIEALSVKLEELLSVKLRECSDVIRIWKSEFSEVITSESRQIAAP